MFTLTFLNDASSIADDEILGYIDCWFNCVVFWSMTIPSYYITKGVFFANMSENPLNGVFVSVHMVFASFTWCSFAGYAKFRLWHYCRTLRSCGYGRRLVNGSCVRYTVFVEGDVVFPYAHNAE